MTGFIGDDVSECQLECFCDADFAGDAISQRSTTGVHFALHGRHALFPLQGVSKKQSAVALATPEAEMIAANFGYRSVMIPAMDLWAALASRTPLFHEDNQATIMVTTSGRNPPMRHLGRVHRVSVQWLHEQLGGSAAANNCILFYENTANMSADICTKSFKDEPSWSHALKLINMVKPNELALAMVTQWLDQRAELGNQPPAAGQPKFRVVQGGAKEAKAAGSQPRQASTAETKEIGSL